MGYCNLHLHTNRGSGLDSMIRINEVIKKAKDLGHTHIACTDHGSLSALYEFHKECKKNNIVPILGCEFYESQGSMYEKSGDIYHLIILAKNKKGYENLIALQTEGNINGKYNGKGRIDIELLKKHNKGLICLSACLSGRLARTIIKDPTNFNKIKSVVSMYRDIFDDDYYLEIQDNGIEDQNIVNGVLRKLSKDMDIDMVFTSDVHYLDDGDDVYHDILKRIQYNKKVPSGFDGHGYFFKGIDGIADEYKKYACTDCVTDKIESYDINLSTGYKMPSLANSGGILGSTCFEMLEKYLKKNILEYRHNEYKERLEYELSVINGMNFSDYFLVVADFVAWAKDNGVFVGVGRGSAAGSLVSFLLDIIGIDPLNEQCPLYFERFLNPDRVSMPDIDVDVDDRDKVINYLKAKYGNDCVVGIGTLSRLQTRSILWDVSRKLGYNDSIIKPLLAVLPSDLNDETNLSLYENNAEYNELVDNDTGLQEIFKYACKLEGLYKNVSKHASGVIISSEKITDVPLNIDKDYIYTVYDMRVVEELGYVKFDVLGVKTLEVINETMRKVGNGFDVRDIDYFNPDLETMMLIRSGNTSGLFQWSSSGYQGLIKQIAPQKFTELVDLSTLYRPGCMESGMTESYINRKNGTEAVTHIHTKLEKILTRYGLPLFQEEVMLVCKEVGNFTMAEADIIRKAIGKKDKDLLEEMKPKFITGCISNGLSDDKASTLWEQLEKFGRYGFNLSHGMAYTVISYWTAYLSAHYPAHYFASKIDVPPSPKKGESRTDIIVSIVDEAKKRGVKIVSPDINRSEIKTVVNNDCIYLSFQVIKNISETISRKIIIERERGGDFLNFFDFLKRMPKKDCNRRAKRALVFAGAFDQFLNCITERGRLISIIDDEKDNKNILSRLECVQEEYNNTGIYFSDNPIDCMKYKIYNAGWVVVRVQRTRDHMTKNNKKMMFLDVTDYVTDYSVMAFSEIICTWSSIMKSGSILALRLVRSNFGYTIADICPLLVNGLEIKDSRLIPVTSFENEVSSNFSCGYNRYIAKEQQNGVIVIYYYTGVTNDNNEEYNINNIIGYRINKEL